MKKSIVKIVLGVMVISILSLGIWKVAYAAVIDQGSVVKVTTANEDQLQLKEDRTLKAETVSAIKDESVAKSPHAMSILDKAIIVGLYEEAYVEPTAAATVDVTSSASIKEDPNASVAINQTQSNVKVIENNVASKSVGTSSTSFTLTELKKYSGQNGNPAYIAVKGIVYDVTALGSWSGGSHNGYKAGTDLTTAFAQSPHAMSILNQAKIVGSIGETTIANTKANQNVIKDDSDDDDDQDEESDDHDDNDDQDEESDDDDDRHDDNDDNDND